MTKLNFEKLKEKLTRFNRKQVNEYLKKCLDDGSGFTFEEEAMISLGAEMNFKKSAAIITELIEIIQSQSEALDNLIGHVDASLLFPHKDRIDLFKAEQKSRQSLSETNTRLQKLSEELND